MRCHGKKLYVNVTRARAALSIVQSRAQTQPPRGWVWARDQQLQVYVLDGVMAVTLSFTKEQAAMLQPLLAIMAGPTNAQSQRTVPDQRSLFSSPASASPSVSNSEISDSASPPSGQYSVEDMLTRKSNNRKSSRAQAYLLVSI